MLCPVLSLLLICVVGAIIWGLHAGKKRREAMGLLAEQLGLQFPAGAELPDGRRYTFLDKLRQGSNRYAYNMMSGGFQGHDITAFDYHYETHSTDSKGRGKRTITIFHSSSLPWKSISGTDDYKGGHLFQDCAGGGFRRHRL